MSRPESPASPSISLPRSPAVPDADTTTDPAAKLRVRLLDAPDDAGARYALGGLLAEGERYVEAALEFYLAQAVAPDDARLEALATALGLARFTETKPWAILAYRSLLTDGKIDLRTCMGAILSLLRCDVEVAGLLAADEAKLTQVVRDALTRPMRLADNTLFLEVMRRELISDDGFEAAFSRLRRSVLMAVDGKRVQTETIRLVVALALQCHNTEYAYFVTPAEDDAVDRLRESLVGGDFEDPVFGLAVLACYESLRLLAQASAPLATVLETDTDLRPLYDRMIVEPAEEERLRGAIPALGAIDNDVSRKVRRQYEENPYPRWSSIGIHGGSTLGDRLAANFPGFDGRHLNGPIEMLVAGCGTGKHPISTALEYPHADILAVDLSLSSLAYGKRMAQRLGVDRVEFAQGDILGLDGLARRFDVVECVGVLHHMQDPLAGWRVLRGLLKPGGVMFIGLYSERARGNVVAVADWIRKEGIAPTPEGLRAFRRRVLEGSVPEAFRATAGVHDFFSLSGCRDMYFHIQEQRYTIPRLRRELDVLDLEPIGFLFPDPIVLRTYRQSFPGDSSRTDLGNWEILEQQHPRIFGRMYQFYCRPRGGG